MNQALPVMTIVHRFSVPPALVFAAWGSAEKLRRWFCPDGFTVLDVTAEFHDGGLFEVGVRGPDDTEFRTRGRFVEIAPHERLVIEMERVGMGRRALYRARTEVTFKPAHGGTRMAVRQSYTMIDSAALYMIRGAEDGWRQVLGKLDLELVRESPGDRSAVDDRFQLERLLAASPEQVYAALSEPALKARWFGGGAGFTELERAMDFLTGGRERLVGQWDNGVHTRYEAVFADIVPNRRIVYTYRMYLDGRKISVSLATVQLAPEGAGTRLTVTEYGVYLDGYTDNGARARSGAMLLDRLERMLAG